MQPLTFGGDYPSVAFKRDPRPIGSEENCDADDMVLIRRDGELEVYTNYPAA